MTSTNSVVKFLMLLIVTGSSVKRLLDKSLLEMEKHTNVKSANWLVHVRSVQTARSGQSMNQSSLGASAAGCWMQSCGEGE